MGIMQNLRIMRHFNFFGLFLFCVFITSCQQDVSGTYKAINPSDQFEKELIIQVSQVKN